jgi:hypothetical protein
LIFKPEDKRCSACDKDDFEVVKLRCEFSESILVLIVKAIAKTPELLIHRPFEAYPCCVHFTRRAGGPVSTSKGFIGYLQPILRRHL